MFKGASIALKEFLSGDITSLARRFEIPRDVLNNIKGLGSSAAQIEALDGVLNNLGLTQQVLTNQTQTTAVEYEKLAGRFADAQAQVGQALAQLGVATGVTTGLTALFKGVAEGLDAFNNRGDAVEAFRTKLVLATNNADQFNERIRQANATAAAGDPLFNALVLQFQGLSEAQFQFAKASSGTEAGLQGSLATIKAVEDALKGITDVGLEGLGSLFSSSAQGAKEFETAALGVAETGPEGIAVIKGYAAAMIDGSITSEQAAALLLAYADSVRLTAAAHQEETAAVTDTNIVLSTLNEQLSTSIVQNAAAAVQTELLKTQQQALYSAAQAAALGMGDSSAAAAALAAQFSITTGEAYALIGALQALAGAKAAAELGLNPREAQRKEEQVGGRQQLIALNEEVKLREQIKKINQAGEFNRADTAGKLRLAREELAGLKAGTLDYANAQQKVLNLEKQSADEAERNAKKKKGGGGSPKLSDATKLNNALLSQQDKFNNQEENAEIKHLNKMTDIYEKFNKQLIEQQNKNEVSKRRIRENFFSGFKDSPDGLDTGAFAAEFEKAFAEAQAIAQKGQAKLADEFLKLRASQINELKQLEEERLGIVNDEDTNKKQKASQLEFLEGRKKLIQDAQNEELQQLLAAGDDIQNGLKEQLSAEEEAYAEQTAKISKSANDAADNKVAAAERAKKKITEENKLLADQVGLLDSAGAKANAVLGDKTAPPTNKPLEGTVPEIPVVATKPLPVAAPTGNIPVLQTGLWLVRDEDVINAIGDQTARLEGKLDSVIGAISDAKDRLASALSSVEGAVRSNRNTTTVVQA